MRKYISSPKNEPKTNQGRVESFKTIILTKTRQMGQDYRRIRDKPTNQQNYPSRDSRRIKLYPVYANIDKNKSIIYNYTKTPPIVRQNRSLKILYKIYHWFTITISSSYRI